MRVSRYVTLPDTDAPAWPAWVPAGNRRRLDALNRLCCSVVDGIVSQVTLPNDTAVVVANSYGSVDSTLRFATSIMSYGDQSASPTAFTTSVHNSSAGALCELLNLHGPSTTISQGGTGGLSALRWGMMMLASGRAPAVLAVIADRHVAWSRDIVTRLSACRWPIGDGASALLIEPGPGSGRELRLGAHAADVCMDGGALLLEDEQMLARLAGTQQRQRAPDTLGRWWPCCLLSAIRWEYPGALQLREIEDQHVMEMWMGPPKSGET